MHLEGDSEDFVMAGLAVRVGVLPLSGAPFVQQRRPDHLLTA